MIKEVQCAKCETVAESFESHGERWVRCPLCRKEARVSDIQVEGIRRHIEKRDRDKGFKEPVGGEAHEEWVFSPA